MRRVFMGSIVAEQRRGRIAGRQERGYNQNMTPESFKVVLAKLLERRPFTPFTLELVSGSRIEVNHPEALTLYEHLVVCVSTSTRRSVFEYASVVRFIEGTGVS
jgi:hypothetical protein